MKSDTLSDGRKIIERTPAKLKVPSYEEPVAHATIDEILLDDGTVVFQCVHPDPIPGTDKPCDYISDLGVGVRAHQKAHGKVAYARHAQIIADEAVRRAEQVEAELNERKRRKSEGAKKGHEARKRNGSVPVTNDPQVGELATLHNALEALDRTHNLMSSLIGPMSEDIQTIRKILSGLTIGVDPEIIDKAAKFDALRDAFKS